MPLPSYFACFFICFVVVVVVIILTQNFEVRAPAKMVVLADRPDFIA